MTPPHETSDDAIDVGVQVIPPHKTSADAMDVNTTTVKLAEISGEVGMYDFNHLQMFVSRSRVELHQTGSPPLKLHDSHGLWIRHFSVMSFLLNGHLYIHYRNLGGMLGFPHISHTQWHRLVKKLEPHVTKLAEWSCSKVREAIKEGGTMRSGWLHMMASIKHEATTPIIHLRHSMTIKQEILHGLHTGQSEEKAIIGRVHLVEQRETC